MTEIEFTDEEIAAMAYDYSYDAAIRAKFVAALPPEPCGHICSCTSDECPHGCPYEES